MPPSEVRHLNGRVVGTQGDEAAVIDPALQARIAAVQARAALVQHAVVGLLLHLEHQVGEAGVQAHEVPGLHLDLLRLHQARQRVVPDLRRRAAELTVAGR